MDFGKPKQLLFCLLMLTIIVCFSGVDLRSRRYLLQMLFQEGVANGVGDILLQSLHDFTWQPETSRNHKSSKESPSDPLLALQPPICLAGT